MTPMWAMALLDAGLCFSEEQEDECHKIIWANTRIFCGFKIKEDLKGKVHLQHLCIENSSSTGVWGSSSFSLNDVIIKRSNCFGLVASGSSTRVTCTNVIVCNSNDSGVRIEMGASVKFNGEGSRIFDNCKKGGGYGVELVHRSSKIQIVSPLTKEDFSNFNAAQFEGINWNWGAVEGATLDQIEEITEK